MPRTWSGVLARTGVPTGDGRIIDPAGLTNRALPVPLMWQEKTEDGHGGAVTVGSIDTITYAAGMVLGEGRLLDLFPERARLVELIETGVVGPSVDLADDVEYVMDDDGRIVITQASIGGATLVPIEAFSDVSIQMTDDECDPAAEDCSPISNYGLTASVRTEGWSDMPIADASRDWDGDAAADRVFSWAGGPDEVDWSRYARAFLRKDDDTDPETRGAYGFGIADVIDGTLTIVPRGVFAAAAAVEGARTGEAPEDAEGMKGVLRTLYARMDRPAPFSSHWAQWDLTASATPKVLPPLAWFAKPDLDRLTPLTISDSGRVFGHIGGRDTCHVGLPGCVTPPMGYSDYSHFHVAPQEVQEGHILPVGTLVAGPRHADPQLAFRAAQEHYDDVNAAVAKVVAGEDEFGIWVAGWMLPDAKPEAVEVFKSSPVSGDWRSIGGQLELIAVCSVNTPGFPIPRARVAFSNGAQRTLVASFGIKPQDETFSMRDANGTIVVDSMAEARAKWAWVKATTEGR